MTPCRKRIFEETGEWEVEQDQRWRNAWTRFANFFLEEWCRKGKGWHGQVQEAVFSSLEEATGNAPSQLDGQAQAASIFKDIPAIHDLYENLMAKDETIVKLKEQIQEIQAAEPDVRQYRRRVKRRVDGFKKKLRKLADEGCFVTMGFITHEKPRHHLRIPFERIWFGIWNFS